MPRVDNDIRARLESSQFDYERVELRELRGREAISEPFAFDLQLVAPNEIAFSGRALLGKDVSIVLSRDHVDVRTVHGMVAEAVDEVDAGPTFTMHRLRVVPRLHRLALSTTSEVFLGKSVTDIAREKLGRVGLFSDDLRVQVRQPARPSDFRLQYAETDLAFVSRHLERAGIAYSFDQSSGKDVLVLSDDNGAFDSGGAVSLAFVGQREKQGVSAIEIRSSMMANKHTVDDYAALHPKLGLRGEHRLDVPFTGEVNEFGGGQSSPQEANALAEMRALSRQAQSFGVEGVSNLLDVEAARTVIVERHPGLGADPHIVVWVEHKLSLTVGMHDRGEANTASSYENRFRLVDARPPYRPALTTPWPHIAGYVHAVTDAPPTGEPDLDPLIDEQGRYTVRFYFDRADADGRRTSSARVRMLQPHAGAGYGMHFPLKPGVEVAVAFMDGDPDRPMILGAVHDGLNRHVVTSSNAKVNQLETRSGIHITLKDS